MGTLTESDVNQNLLISSLETNDKNFEEDMSSDQTKVGSESGLVPSGDSVSTTSDDTEESVDEESLSEEEDNQRCEEEMGAAAAVPKKIPLRGMPSHDGEDLLLHSLESERYGPSVQKYISKYLDDDLNTFLMAKSKKEKGDGYNGSNLNHGMSGGRTIKAATRHIDAQKRAASTLSSASHSMIDLTDHFKTDQISTSPFLSGEHTSSGLSTGLAPMGNKSPSTTGIRSIIESQMLQEKEALTPNRQQEIKRKQKKRQVHKTRERDAKTSEADVDASSNGAVSVKPLKLKSQFSCLRSRPTFQKSHHDQNGSLHGMSSSKSMICIQDCSVERVQFYKNISQIIRKGKKGSFGSNTSGWNAGGFIELVFKQELRDLIWLEIQGWMDNRNMIDEDSYLCNQRRKIPQTLQQILKFRVIHHRSRENSVPYENQLVTPRSSPVTVQSETGSKKPIDSEVQNDLRILIDADKLAASVALKLNMKESGDEKSSADELSQRSSSPSGGEEDQNCCCSETLSRICQYCVNIESESLVQVKSMIDDLEQMESLYPCSKALAGDYPLYSSEQLVNRMKTLYLFINITRDMREKINLLAKLFQIQDRESAGWPDFENASNHSTPKTDEMLSESLDATPEVRNHHQDVYGYSYKLSSQASNMYGPNGRHVHFTPQVAKISENAFSTQNSDKTLSAPDSPDVQGGSPYESPAPHVPSSKANYFFTPKQSIYRRYVDKSLKHKGLRYIYHQLSHILRPLLYRVHAALKKPSSYSYADAVASNPSSGSSWKRETTSKKSWPVSREYCEELSAYGVWSAAYQQMGLPTLHRPFLFLLRVTVDVVHECLRLRLEQQPEQPSAVSVAQLIRECKEVLRAGVQIRQRYVNLAQTVLGEGGTDAIEAQLDPFDDDLKTMLEIYLKYLEQYMLFMQKVSKTTSSTLKQKGYLESEWNFIRTFCIHIPDGESLAANKFCQMASALLTSIGDYIQNGIDECFVMFNESIAAAPQDIHSFRKGILKSCRNFKAVFQEASGRAVQATAFAKSLRKDLEFAAEFRPQVDLDLLLKKLKETGHIRVFFPNCCLNYLMFVPNYMQGSESYIWQLLDLTSGGRGVESDVDFSGYLLVIHCPDRELTWSGTTVLLELAVEASISLSHVQLDGVLFVTNQPSNLELQCRQFQQMMAGTLTIYKQQTSCNRTIARALNDLKTEALEIQNKISHSLNLIYDQVDISRVPHVEEQEMKSLQGRCLDVCHLGFRFAFEYEKGLTRLITGDLKANLSKQLIAFGLQWIKFVTNKCDAGRAARSRWSNQGLQYLLVALEPQYLVGLTDDEFNFLKDEVEKFMVYIQKIRDQSTKSGTEVNSNSISIQGPYSVLAATQTLNRPLASSLNFSRSQSVSSVKGVFGENGLPSLERQQASGDMIQKGTRLEEWAQTKKNQNSSSSLKISLRKMEEADENSIESPEIKPIEKAQKAIEKLEEKRRKKLQESGVIGDVSSFIIQRAPLQVAARKVNFPWQRGFKIGEGRFGKVYTAVNNSTGELIAMKEIHLQPNDHRAVKETIDEIRTFEGIKHPNLVRYFGVEIHREDLYIFMEYCNEGTLESAVQLNLPEQLVRKYTRQLLEAVNVLHENGIVHRDIKSANIFLTSDGNLKLGDFGCCMKLKNQTTMAGELSAFVGTPAYMAPEIFTRNAIEGHGRAADIWSIGCVVLEMLSGRRPWHDLENSYQIMFKVGMGESPEVPDDICPEGASFISHCLQHDPRLRLSTGQLLNHTFIKVVEDDDDDSND